MQALMQSYTYQDKDLAKAVGADTQLVWAVRGCILLAVVLGLWWAIASYRKKAKARQCMSSK